MFFVPVGCCKQTKRCDGTGRGLKIAILYGKQSMMRHGSLRATNSRVSESRVSRERSRVA